MKVNGKLFNQFILANFRKFKIPKRDMSIDPCGNMTEQKLRVYQVFAAKYLNYNSPYKDIILYHQMGSGKTRSAINIYNVLYNSYPGWNVFLLIKAALKNSPWMTDLEKMNLCSL